MGYRVAAECYDTLADAQSAFYSSQNDAFVVGTTTQGQIYHFTGTAWNVKGITITSGGVIATRWDVAAPVRSFATCTQMTNTESFVDGLTLGWGVVAAMAVAWGYKQMKGQVK